jgi:hypothetical protein
MLLPPPELFPHLHGRRFVGSGALVLVMNTNYFVPSGGVAYYQTENKQERRSGE